MHQIDPPNPNDLPSMPISSSAWREACAEKETVPGSVVPDNPVAAEAQKLIDKRRKDGHLLSRIALTVLFSMGCVGGFATCAVAFAVDRANFGWVSLIGVVSFIAVLYTAVLSAIWLAD